MTFICNIFSYKERKVHSTRGSLTKRMFGACIMRGVVSTALLLGGSQLLCQSFIKCEEINTEQRKMLLGYRAIEKFVKDDMIIGLGSGILWLIACLLKDSYLLIVLITCLFIKLNGSNNIT